MGQHWVVLTIPLIVGLVTYVVVRLVWKRDKLAVPDGRNESLSVDSAGTEKRLLQAEGRRDRISPLGTVTLLTTGVIGGFSFVWYFMNSHSPLVLMLKHLAAFDN